MLRSQNSGADYELALLAALRPQGDADALVDLFTPREGAVTLLARGLLKPGSHLSARLKPADELTVLLAARRRGWPLLTGCEPQRLHPLWQADLTYLALYWFMLECAVAGSGPPEQNADVFRLLVNLLRSEPDGPALPACACAFALKLLGLHGLLPDLTTCCLDGHTFTADEPVFLLARGEGLVGRAAYNAQYARAAGQSGTGLDTPQGLLRLGPQRRQRWAVLLHGPLLAYPSSGCDLVDSAVLTQLLTQAIADLAQRALHTHSFLVQQWDLPRGRELAQSLAA